MSILNYLIHVGYCQGMAVWRNNQIYIYIELIYIWYITMNRASIYICIRHNMLDPWDGLDMIHVGIRIAKLYCQPHSTQRVASHIWPRSIGSEGTQSRNSSVSTCPSLFLSLAHNNIGRSFSFKSVPSYLVPLNQVSQIVLILFCAIQLT